MARALSYEELLKKVKELEKKTSEYKKAEEALQKSEAHLESIIRVAPIGAGIVLDRIFRSVNDRFCEMTGYSKEELIGRNTRILYADDEEHEKVGREEYEDIKKYGLGNAETKFIRKDGKIIDVVLSLTPLINQNIAEGVTFTVLDITERKSAEEALRESEKRFREFAELLPETVCETDLEGNLLFVSHRAYEVFGYTKEEFERGLNALQMLMPEDRDRALANMVKVLKGGQQRGIEYTALRKNGTTFPVLVYSNILVREEKPAGLRSIIIDISEHKQAVREKERLQSQLQQAHKMEAIGTLAGGIAHDFNNILGIIVGNTEIALMDVPDWNPGHHNLEEIRKACLRARDLVKQILAFSRQTKQELKPVRISRIIKESLKLLRSSIPTTIEIRQNFSTKSDTVNADSTQINQVLLNLCTNATHAMREKGGVLEVSVENVQIDKRAVIRHHCLQPGKYVKLTVSDTAHGIDPEIIEQIFDPYFTTKEVGEGTGIGLAVAQGIVKKHGGAISVDSKLNKGTKFHVFLPSIEVYVKDEYEKADEPPRGSERILFVDDEKAMVDTVQSMLEHLGYMVTTRTSSIEALEAFKARPDKYDLVITDMTMPNMTGKELARELMSVRPDIPAILCTGFSEQIDEDTSREMGIDAFVMKPIVMGEIANAIRRVLNKE